MLVYLYIIYVYIGSKYNYIVVRLIDFVVGCG